MPVNGARSIGSTAQVFAPQLLQPREIGQVVLARLAARLLAMMSSREITGNRPSARTDRLFAAAKLSIPSGA
jgi:hypothetical protein